MMWSNIATLYERCSDNDSRTCRCKLSDYLMEAPHQWYHRGFLTQGLTGIIVPLIVRESNNIFACCRDVPAIRNSVLFDIWTIIVLNPPY